MSPGPNLGLAPSVEHLITELGAVRDTLRDESDSEWARQLLSHVSFKEHHGPHGIRALVWGLVLDDLMRPHAAEYVSWVMVETHRQYGIPGAFQPYDNASWLYRWDDQG